MNDDLTEVPDFSDRLARVSPPQSTKERLSVLGRSSGVWAFSISVHVLIAVVGYKLIRHWNVFGSAQALAARGDGAAEGGRLDHAGPADTAPGAEGSGSLRVGWSPPVSYTPKEEVPAIQPDPHPADVPQSQPPDLPADDDLAEDSSATTPATLIVDALSDLPLPKVSHLRAAPIDPEPGADPSPVDPPAAKGEASERSDAAHAGKGDSEASAESATVASSNSHADTAGGLRSTVGAGGSKGQAGRTSAGGGSGLTGQPGSSAGLAGSARTPDYPLVSRQRREAGDVVLQVEVLPDGRVGTIKVLSDAGYPRLARAAIEAARFDSFVPAHLDGRPVVSTLARRYVFNLR